MNDRIEQAMTAEAATATVTATTLAGPALDAFIGAEDTRLRDLLAFGYATEAGRIGPDGVEGLRRKADAALTDHAFRTLHNEVERIRREAAEEERGRIAPSGGFGRAVGANLVALGLFAGAALLLAAANPGLFARLARLATGG